MRSATPRRIWNLYLRRGRERSDNWFERLDDFLDPVVFPLVDLLDLSVTVRRHRVKIAFRHRD